MNPKNAALFIQKGSITIFVLLFGVVGSLIVGGIVMLASLQYDSSIRSNEFEQALSIAESGIQYYRWHLAHSPNDYTDGTGVPGPYVHEFKDAQGDVIGHFSLLIQPPQPGSSIVTITSTGSTIGSSAVKRTVTARLGIPSFSRYAFLHNSSVFFGSGITVHGQVLANGGIRQDGTNDSLLQSSLTTYTCGRETGCNPSRIMPAVWGSGGLQDLWIFPVPAVDFDSVTLSYAAMKADAQTIGVYYGPSGSLGYRVLFRENGSVDVYRVTRLTTIRGYDPSGTCVNLPQIITRETFLANYLLSSKHILFFEDTVWVEGVVNGQVTVVAARFPIDTNNMDMWIKNTIRYAEKDGTNQLGLIAQRNIFYVRDLPTNFEINGALLAQRGTVFRHGYYSWWCGSTTNAVRNSLTIYGSIIGGQPSGWNWGTPTVSGFLTRTVTHDNHLTLNPPPYFPVNRSDGYEFVSWTEDENP